MPQMFYDVISTLYWNVTLGPGCLISDVTMEEHACSRFSIKNDNGSEVCSPVLEESANIIVTLALLPL